jgi:hypothetical protein
VFGSSLNPASHGPALLRLGDAAAAALSGTTFPCKTRVTGMCLRGRSNQPFRARLRYGTDLTLSKSPLGGDLAGLGTTNALATAGAGVPDCHDGRSCNADFPGPIWLARPSLVRVADHTDEGFGGDSHKPL